MPITLYDGQRSPHARKVRLLAAWAPNEAERRRVLVENPEALYGFEKTA